jgi:hypothetical protein
MSQDDFDTPLFPDSCHFTPTARPWRDMYTDPQRMLRHQSSDLEDSSSKLIVLWREFPELFSGWPGLLLRHLPVKALVTFSRCCKTFKHLCQDPLVSPHLNSRTGCLSKIQCSSKLLGCSAVSASIVPPCSCILWIRSGNFCALWLGPGAEGLNWFDTGAHGVGCTYFGPESVQMEFTSQSKFVSSLRFSPPSHGLQCCECGLLHCCECGLARPAYLGLSPCRWSTIRYGTDEGHGSKEAGKSFYRPVIITCMYRIIYFVDGERFAQITTNTDTIQPDQVFSAPPSVSAS